MNCKKCNAELEEGVQICPECGMNQAEAAENAVPAEVKDKGITLLVSDAAFITA